MKIYDKVSSNEFRSYIRFRGFVREILGIKEGEYPELDKAVGIIETLYDSGYKSRRIVRSFVNKCINELFGQYKFIQLLYDAKNLSSGDIMDKLLFIYTGINKYDLSKFVYGYIRGYISLTRIHYPSVVRKITGRAITELDKELINIELLEILNEPTFEDVVIRICDYIYGERNYDLEEQLLIFEPYIPSSMVRIFDPNK